jgi:hypothetical protein
MAYINVLAWKCEHVVQWLRGLDDSIYPYCYYFVNNNVNGQKLLNLTVSDLTKLHVEKLGHQEIILEALEKLKNLHHNLDTENLQYLALKLSCKARSLFNELYMQENQLASLYVSSAPLPTTSRQRVNTSTMASVAEVLDALVTILSWLDKPPFGSLEGMIRPAPSAKNPYPAFSESFVSVGIELATNAQRDTFAEKPIEVIKACCKRLAELSDTLIQNLNDPLILQPASLDVASTKKRPGDEDCGLVLDTTWPGTHMVSELRFGSLAHQCGRIQIGDEVVQLNYQTVVGWSTKMVMKALNECDSELILTLKKRPRHLNGCGQIYMKPFRIPARQENTSYFNNLPSPRAELLVAPDITFPLPKRNMTSAPEEFDHKDDDSIDVPDHDNVIFDEDDVDDIDDEVYLPTTSSTKDISPTQSVRSLLLRPRSTPIRRATISAGSPSKYQPYINVSEFLGLFDTAKSNKSNKSNNSDQGSKASSSATSTMHSNDSGCATMYSSSGQDYSPSSKGGRPLTIGPEYINMMEAKIQAEEYINLFSCSTPSSAMSSSSSAVGKRHPPPPPTPPKQPIPKPRLNVSLSREPSSGDDSSTSSSKKKRPVPQPRSVIPKSASMTSTRMVSMSSEVQPVPSPSFKSFKKYPASTPDLVELPKAPLTATSSSSSSSSSEVDEDNLPPALPKRQSSVNSRRASAGPLTVPYYVSDLMLNQDDQGPLGKTE